MLVKTSLMVKYRLVLDSFSTMMKLDLTIPCNVAEPHTSNFIAKHLGKIRNY